MKPTIFSYIALNRLARKNPFFSQLKAVPAAQLDVREFKRQYKRNRKEWDAALAFLRDSDLQSLALGHHDITENTFAKVQEYTTVSSKDFEAHQDYIDIQYIVSGQEIIEVAPTSKAGEVTMPYSKEKDCILYASAQDVDEIYITPDVFCILFPYEAHKPGITFENPSDIRKVIVKVPYVK